MSLETDLVAVLHTLCPRVFPDVAPTTTQRPYITYQQVGGERAHYVEGQQIAKVNALVQINVWHDTRLAANTLSRQVEAALLAATTLQAEPEGALVAAFDDATELRGAQQDFSIWGAR
jgi:hypothetical protein